jgi:hypothetical protein
MEEFENTPRITFLNRPGDAASFDYLRRQVGDFIRVDKKNEFFFVVLFPNTVPHAAQSATIRVFYPYPSVVGEVPEKVGVYSASEDKRFETDIKRVTAENPTGDVELSENELYNGLFNVAPDPMDGWIVQDDNTGGGLLVKVKNARLHITSPGMGSFVIENNKTFLTNLVEYDTLFYISEVIGDADARIAIGGSMGAVRNAQGSYSELIIGGGRDFTINGNINTPDSEIIIDFIIVNGN